ncbi:MAG: hypothetical protein UT58_C0004G0019 [Microgenomates group bacterium GW2011_GWC1_39_7b]|uniref:POTRA domain-containing protein n=1 Tax=Candidatus Woesebacteria bacterium GW2011_GWA1_43_12 TaxID=1618557 RepID=A0A0G1F6E4_9BACT|nr:MAG: hypothetical protein UT58_C0004G0019 [Microgenomates group bacterium GW2011_GWC1_39_7b]KKS90731.1 MAG: hypothetical protein UV66_C0001G0088 [Candidatus Woesebacteria bacterium GW2011_GWA1_43_12]
MILFCFILLFFIPFFIKVRIDCKSQFGECPDEVNFKLKPLNSRTLFYVKKNTSKILKADALVSSFSTQYKFPDILEINLIVKKPLFAIKDILTGRIFLIDKDGNILTEAGTTSLPIIVQEGREPNLIALNLILGVYQMYQVLYGTIANDALVVDMPVGLRVIFPLYGDPEVLLGSLRLIYSKIETSDQEEKFSEIDLRFKNAVLR